MIIMVGKWQQAGRHGAGRAAKGLHPSSQAERLGMVCVFEASKPTCSDIPPDISKMFH